MNAEQALEARRQMQGREIAGVPVKVGFAKVPASGKESQASSLAVSPQVSQSYSQVLAERQESAARSSVTKTTSWPLNAPDFVPAPRMPPKDGYCLTLPALPDSLPDRKIDNARMREFRKRLEGPLLTQDQFDEIFHAVLMDAVVASADYVGNVVVQKIMEKGSDEQRIALIQAISPYMAAVGIHKNGTWAVQKIIDLANTPAQIDAIVAALRPYTPPLLLDQFGNYVVQCCLRFENGKNQFIFEAIAHNLVVVGTGRFGARATRTCLDSQYTTKRQQKVVAMAIISHASKLAFDPNGALLVTWLLDSSTLPGKYRAMAPVFAEHIAVYCTNKLASGFILKIVNQKLELEARQCLIQAIFYNEDPQVLAQILCDNTNGVGLIRKLLSASVFSADEQAKLLQQVKTASERSPELLHTQTYKRLLEEFGEVLPLSQSDLSARAPGDDDIVSPLAPRAGLFHMGSANAPSKVSPFSSPKPSK